MIWRSGLDARCDYSTRHGWRLPAGHLRRRWATVGPRACTELIWSAASLTIWTTSIVAKRSKWNTASAGTTASTAGFSIEVFPLQTTLERSRRPIE